MSESRRQRRALERAYKKYRDKLYRDAFRRAKEQEENKQALVLSNVSNSVCPDCGNRGYKTDLTDNSYACKKCLTWWANGC